MSEFFQIGNSFFDLSRLGELKKEDIEKLGDKKLIELFNAINLNGDNILDTSEISLFADKYKTDNNDFDNSSVAKIFGMSISANKDVQKELAEFLLKNPLPEKRSEDEIKDATIDFIFDEYQNGLAAIEGYDEGIISKGYNGIKEFLGSDMAKSSVKKVLYMKNETANLLKRAHEGDLTYSEYYSILRENLMNIYPGLENLTGGQKAQLKEYLDGVDEKGISFLTQEALKVPTSDNPAYREKMKEFSQIFEAVAVEKRTESVTQIGEINSFSTNTEYLPHPKYTPENGEELVTFEEVFQNSYGCGYSSGKFEKLEDFKNKYLMTVSGYAAADRVHEILDKQIAINKGNNTYGANQAAEQHAMLGLESAIFSALKELGAGTQEEQIKLLKELSGYSNIKFRDVEEGALLDLSQSRLEYTNADRPINSYALTDIAEKLLSKIDENKARNYNRTPEQAAQSLQTHYTMFFGQENVDTVVQAYLNDQEGSVQSLRTGVELAGGAAAIIGLFVCPPAALAGAVVGSVGGIGVEALNEATKDEFTQEKKEELRNELIANAALFAASGFAGKAGALAKASLVAKNCPRLLACIADRGLDATLSLLSTYALTGQISLEGEGLSQIITILAGHIAAKRVAKPRLSRQDIAPSKNPAFNTALNDLSKTNPKLYQDFQLLRNNNLLPGSSMLYNPKSSTFTKEFLHEVEVMANAVKNGIKPIDAFIPKFKTVAEASANRKSGEVFSVEGTNDIYYVSSKGAQKLDMDRDMYFKLFPPLESAVTRQGAIGNCYFVTGVLDGSMSNPEAKALLLNKIHQHGNDITIDLGTYSGALVPEAALDKLPYSITFKDAKTHSSVSHNQGISGAQGLKLIEQAYGYKLAADGFAYKIENQYDKPEKLNELLDELNTLFVNPKAKPSKELTEALEFAYGRSNRRVGADAQGKAALAVDGIQALRYKVMDSGGNSTTSIKNFFDLDESASKFVELAEVDAYRNNQNVLMYASSDISDSEIKEELCLLFKLGEAGKYKIAGNHAYRVADVDNVNNTVSVVNPWDTSKVVTLPRDRYEKYFGSRIEIVDMSKTIEAVQSPHLISVLKNSELSNISKQGRYYSNGEMLNMYFKNLKTSKNIEYPKMLNDIDDNYLYKVLPKNPLIKATKRVFKHWNYKPDIEVILAKFGKNAEVWKITEAIRKSADKRYVIGEDVLSLILGHVKNKNDYLFMLEQAPDIAPKLRAKGFDDIQIYQTLANLSRENYRYLKELWE